MDGNIARAAAAHMQMERIRSNGPSAPEKRALRARSKSDPTRALQEIADFLSKSSGDGEGLRYLVGCLAEAMAYADVSTADAQVLVEHVRHLDALPEFHILAGSVLHRAGDRKGAYTAFGVARSLAQGNWAFPSHRGAENTMWEDAPSWHQPAPRRRALMPPVQWLKAPSPGRLTVVYAGDKVYFRNLAANALASLDGSKVPVHFHVVGWDDGAEETWRAIERPGVSISTEDYPYPRDFTYFATVRFFRSSEFLRAMGPVYISDLDNVFMTDPLAIDYHRYDAAFAFKMYQDRLPWLSPNAGHVFLNNTAGGLELAQQMANYVDQRFRPNAGRNWYFDQLLLNEVARASTANILGLTKPTMPTVPSKSAETARGKQHRAA